MRKLNPSDIHLGSAGEVSVSSEYWASLSSQDDIRPLSTNGICDNTSNCSGSTNTRTCQNVSACDNASNTRTCYVVEVPPLSSRSEGASRG